MPANTLATATDVRIMPMTRLMTLAPLLPIMAKKMMEAVIRAYVGFLMWHVGVMSTLVSRKPLRLPESQ